MKKKVKAWAIMEENNEKKVESLWLNRWEAVENARDVCFMGSQGLPQKVVPVTVFYEVGKK